MNLKERAAQLRFGVGMLGALGHRNAVVLGNLFQGFEKRDPFDLFEKPEYVAALAASETLVKLARLVHRERRRFFLVKRTQPDVPSGGAHALQADVLADGLDDVDLALYLILKIHYRFKARVTPSLSGSMLKEMRESA